MVSSLVTCTIHIFAVRVAVCTVIERSVHHQTHDAVDNELCIGALVVHLVRRVECSREGARQAQVHFVSFSTSLACQIAAADLVYEFGHVAEMVLISNALSFSHNLVACSQWLLRGMLHRFDLHDMCEEQ